MKLAFTTAGEDLHARLDPRFGRAPGFLVYDTDHETIAIVDNTAAREESQGAGLRAAERIASLGVECVITGHCGPKAFDALSAAGIKVYPCPAETVAAALEDYRAGRLAEATFPDVPGHGG